MLGVRFMKAQPNTYVLQYKGGRVVRKGTGLAFFYYGPTCSLVAIPMASVDEHFIFEEVTADFQDVTIQGQVTYRVSDPQRLAQMLNFTLAPNNRAYACDDPMKLRQRVINQIQVLVRNELQHLSLREALQASDDLVQRVRGALFGNALIEQLGLEVLALSIVAVKPNPETARALEAEIRELLLQEADEAIYKRRNAAVEQERAIKENELNTEIAVETKKRQIRETKIEADRAVQEKRQIMEQEKMEGKITLEKQNEELVALTVENKKAQADAEAYGAAALMDVFKTIDPRTTQALANAGMDPAHLVATAFQNLADNADKIGNLNIAPELMQELLQLKQSH